MQTAFTLPMLSFCLKENQGAVALAAISFGLRLGLRVADGFGQHLAQLGLGLSRFTREGFLPLGHTHYVGMPEGELNPAGQQ